MSATAPAKPPTLQEKWAAAWPAALNTWSRFTRLRAPALCLTEEEAVTEGLTGSFAMIRLTDQAVVVSLPQVTASGVEDFALEVLAHEIGHHVLAPANLTDHMRVIARMRWALPTVEKFAPMVANLYTDLLINDRLQRGSGLRMAEVYRAMNAASNSTDGGAVWTLYLRIYELLWSLPRQSLGGPATDDRLEGDAWLGARLIRSYARDFVEGSGRFAALLFSHLIDDQKSQSNIDRLLDTRHAAAEGDPSGLSEMEPGEREGAIHPSLDPDLADGVEEGNEPAETISDAAQAPAAPASQQGIGQSREPYQYGEILKAAGINLSDHEIAIRYYRERALPHLIRFPRRERPMSTEPMPEGLENWDIGHPLEAVDWLESVMACPRVIPGLTTLQRVWGTTEASLPKPEPLDLDLYVDSSGSMPNPQYTISYLTLAGAIVCLSALRAGSKVQATLWSGKNQFVMTPGFVRDEHAILAVLTGFFGGGTNFPIHILRDTYAQRRPSARPTHIMVISDDGVSTMWEKDEKGNSGWDVSARSLAAAGGGGTLLLNLGWTVGNSSNAAPNLPDWLHPARDVQGWNIHAVSTWEQLVIFAREFSKQRYGQEPSSTKKL